MISDIDSLVATAVNDSSPIAESLIEQSSSSCRKTPWSSEENPSADSKLNNCAEEKSETIHSGSLSLRRKSLLDAALHRDLSFMKSIPLGLVGDTEGGEGLAARRAFHVMDPHKLDVSLYRPINSVTSNFGPSRILLKWALGTSLDSARALFSDSDRAPRSWS